MKRKAKSKVTRSGMALVHPNAAAIDIGATMHMAAVGADRASEPVRSFGTFTADLRRLADWFAECGVETVVMESTSVYWIPIFELLDERGFKVFLVNARDAKHVPGRKTDVSDAQWLQRLHSYGLLRASFRPKGEIVELRAYLRQRERLLDTAASQIQHMQKAMTEMNLQLHHVVADITGATGMRIIRAIIAGERDPTVLASMRDIRCRSSVEVIEKALSGHYRAEHLFVLEQALALYDVYQQKVDACDIRIEAVLKQLNFVRGHGEDAGADGPGSPPRKNQKYKGQTSNGPAFDVSGALHSLLGKDLTQIDGIGSYLALKLISECGDDLSAWPSAKHFTAWLCLAPSNKISGGKILSSRTRRTGSRVASLLRLAAVSVGRTETALGAFYRRLSTRVGKAKAITATARKIAVLFYNTVRHGMAYADPGASYYETRYRERVIKNLHRRAKTFGFVLQAVDMPKAGPVVS
jgi:transposase